MSDIFISHSSKDADVARKLQEQLKAKGVSAFVASTSIAPGEKWSPEIKAKLTEAEWVLFLATPNSCTSPAVNQELGGTWVTGKPLIPVLSGIRAEELPAWTKEYQAVDLDKEPERVDGLFTRLGEFLDRKKFWKWLLGGLFGAAILWALAKASKPRVLIWLLVIGGLLWLAIKPTKRQTTSTSSV